MTGATQHDRELADRINERLRGLGEGTVRRQRGRWRRGRRAVDLQDLGLFLGVLKAVVL
jgi:hypothetical protein